MKKYFIIFLVVMGVSTGWAKKQTRATSSIEGMTTTYYFVLPKDSGVAKDFKVTVSKMSKNYLGELKVKLKSDEEKNLQMPCYLITKTKTLRCVREDGGGRFEIVVSFDGKGEKIYTLKIHHLDLGTEQDEPVAISGPSANESLTVTGRIVLP